MGTLKGGDKFRARLAELAQKLQKQAEVQVGYPQGSTDQETGISLPLMATVQEYGAPAIGIPPRPFFRPLVEQGKEEWGAQFCTLLQAYEFDVARALNAMGKQMSIEMMIALLDASDAPLSAVASSLLNNISITLTEK